METDRGARAVLIIVGLSLVIGGIVLMAHPLYRRTLSAWLKGEKEASPIRQTNARYYPAVGAAR